MTEKTEKKRSVQLPVGRFRLAQSVANRWAVTLAPHMVVDDLFNPEFWSIIGIQLTRGDFIDVRTDDDSLYVELYVTDCSRIHANMFEMRRVDLTEKEPKMAYVAYKYQWKGTTLRHCAIRESDGEVMLDKQPTKADVDRWIANQPHAPVKAA